MLWMVVKEFWRRYKLGTLIAITGVTALILLWLTGWLWAFENWIRSRISVGRQNPIVVCALLLAMSPLLKQRKTPHR